MNAVMAAQKAEQAAALAAEKATAARAHAAQVAALAAEKAASTTPRKRQLNPRPKNLASWVTVRFPPGGRAALDALAAEANVCLADYLRDVIAGRRPPLPEFAP